MFTNFNRYEEDSESEADVSLEGSSDSEKNK